MLVEDDQVMPYTTQFLKSLQFAVNPHLDKARSQQAHINQHCTSECNDELFSNGEMELQYRSEKNIAKIYTIIKLGISEIVWQITRHWPWKNRLIAPNCERGSVKL